MDQIWTQTLAALETEVSGHNFNTWIRPLKLRSLESEKAIVEVPNGFYRNRLEQSYRTAIESKLRQSAELPLLEVAFELPNESPKEASLLKDITRAKKEISRQEQEVRSRSSEALNDHYTFENFVVGGSNQFAHAAASAVAASPGRTYNPLFIYGGVGLGKTHLLCAVGHRIARDRPGARIVFRPAERFTNELINAIRFEKTGEFRSRYRDNCDILLIDDIQFLSGKERTQEEFFHTFNTLYEANKQIVMTSDRFPNEISDLDERLRSRFQWGLLCDIQPPDVETRVAILRKKAGADRVVLPDDVANYLANHIKSNVRVLEGALIRLAAFASISGREITLDLTKEVFGTLAPESPSLSIDLIQKRTSEFFNLNVSDLKSARRHKVVALPRQVAMYLARKLTSASFPEIGEKFGGKDHTTVIHAVQKIERLLQLDSPLRNTVGTIEQTLTVRL